MKATEIVEKLKSVLLSSDDTAEVKAEEVNQEEVNEIEVNEPVALEAMPEDEASAEDVAEDVAEEEIKYATKEELDSAIAEIKAMYESIVEKMGSEEMETEVPSEELAEELSKEELSAEEPAAEPIAHSPEVEASAPKLQAFAARRPRNTMDTVYAKMFNK